MAQFNDNKVRTNQYANQNNAIQLKGLSRLVPSDFEPEADIAIAAGGATATLTGVKEHTNPDTLYFGIVIRDQSLNSVGDVLNLASPGTPVVVDTSSLDPTDNWTIEFAAAKESASDNVPAREEIADSVTAAQIAAGVTVQFRLEV